VDIFFEDIVERIVAEQEEGDARETTGRACRVTAPDDVVSEQGKGHAAG
jgi:hypothetical protein